MAVLQRQQLAGRWTLVALVMTLMLAACNGGGEDPSADGNTEPATAAPAETETGTPTETEGTSDADVGSLHEAAQQEGGLTLYSSQNPELIETVISEFQAEYPDVNVDFLRLASGALATRFSEEQSADVCEADAVIIADPGFLDQGQQEGWWASLDGVPAINDWPEEFLQFEGTSAKITIIPTGIAYNTDLVDEGDAPETWEGILNDQFADDLVLVDPRATPGWMALYRIWMEEFGPDFLEDLAAQGFTLADSSVPGAQQVAAGEAALLVPTIESVQASLVEEGAPLGTNLVLEGPTTGIEQFINITDCSENRASAELFSHFLLTEQGQTVLNEGFAASPLGDLEGTIPLPADYRDPRITELTPEVEQEILSLLGIQ